MQRTIDTLFWHDPEVRSLSHEGKLFCLYLITSPYGHVSGLFPVAPGAIVADTGLTGEVIDTLWHTLLQIRFAYRDETMGLVWVRNLLKRQGPGQQNEKAAAKQVQTYRTSPLAERLLEYYPAVRRWLPKKDRVSNTVSNTVVAHYKTYHSRANPGEAEEEKIRARLAEGYTIEQLCEAIDGCHRSSWHCGGNPEGKKYQSLTLILRDSTHVQQFLEVPKPVHREDRVLKEMRERALEVEQAKANSEALKKALKKVPTN